MQNSLTLNWEAERAEHQLLLLCARHSQGPEQRERFLALLSGQLDWAYLVPRLFRNGLVPLFLHHAPEPCLLPDAIFQELRSEVIMGSLERLTLLTELTQVTHLLRSHGIPILAYKGPALAQVAYGSIKLRSFDDLDLLVAPQHRHQAIALLEVNGYKRKLSPRLPQASPMLPPRLQRKLEAMEASKFEMTLLPLRATGVIDLHWAINAPDEFLPLDLEGIWARRVPVAGLSGIEAPCREDLILCLCVHGVKHLWHRMEWIASVWSLLQSGGGKPLDWSIIEQATATLENQRILHLGLRLALDLGLAGASPEQRTGVESLIPAHVLRAISADIVVSRLSRQVWRICFQGSQSDLSLSHSLIFTMRAREGWRVRLAYLVTSLVTTFQSALFPRLEDIVATDRAKVSTLRCYARRVGHIVGRRAQRVVKRILRSNG